ncbi:TIGR04282 family arsenosugar biosynthesis glycosyltransferase [Cellulophaga sp. HaHa_2_1]|uniref:TIGR04282 family arsenosugar biosynthesis glycosyltransferase n=1 Tax=Cellulophaga sp. HaHa_2_1 TaxID=2749994 RepID=UPI001C4E494D|nr:TIGR04282 family arsenosugar biosynthesis glycosyltransferase [Cellulophaga sp. HaHa_2_1]QXP50598.1 TIGR04282 family arsenosugar biosynthesis glycosyltransferase [Cellulophaga sp. HaHa_2_1]
MSKENLLLIFTRNPELGKCKTRLAASVGDEKALAIYKFLLNHTEEITKNLTIKKQLYYSEEIWKDDIWGNDIYDKKLQKGINLGLRMENAFKAGFKQGYKKIIVIGSDMYDLTQKDLENAFTQLDTSDFVVGPAEDGGYYLLGMKAVEHAVFTDKAWGTPTVLKDTLKNLEDKNTTLLEKRNDVDVIEDIKDHPAFQSFLKNNTHE